MPGSDPPGRALLFEALVDDPDRRGLFGAAPAQPFTEPFRTLDVARARASLRREVSWLLNTRCGATVAELASRERTVLDYGLPDLAGFDVDSELDRLRLAALIREAIAAYEPRLRRPRVTVLGQDRRHQRIGVAVAGEMALGQAVEAVAFQVAVTGVGRPPGEEDGDDEPA